ncbi:MAG TPA: M23 family metallopeptidase [Candidatus Saccharimonadales bacterium]|nr:M23 family metallopeptidase [Candidatus Saccharimonadales bacterium]
MHRFLTRKSHSITRLGKDFAEFVTFFSKYLQKKVMSTSLFLEGNKNQLVKFFMMKRGRYNRPFLHVATIGVLALGILVAPILAETYPLFSPSQNLAKITSPQTPQSIIVGDNVFQTEISEKPRDKVITYTVQRGDTISTIAKKFSTPNNPLSTDTIRWANDLTDDSITVGDTLKILPVSGIAHKVEKGDTIYSIAKKYNTDPQKIVDFPFNDFANPETFSLVVGQMLIVPDGIKPSEQNFIKPQVYIATGPVPVVGGGLTFPVHGGISQFYSWYHQGVDITDPVGTPIVSAQNGTVTEVHIGTYDGGYGNNVWISNGAGIETHYAHMQNVSVSVGQSVTGGATTIGTIGLTGRTTGAHVHFEVRKGGSLVNPMSYLQ